MPVETKSFETNVPATWNAEENKVGSKSSATVTAKQGTEFTDIVELFDGDEKKAVDAVNNLLANQAKQRSYQNALARVKPPDNPEAAKERAITQLIRCGFTEDMARQTVETNSTV